MQKTFPSLVQEQIIQRDFALDDIAVGVVFEAVGGDQCQEDGLAGVGLGAESVKACGEFLFFGERDLKLFLAVLHLAKVDCLVLAVNQEVDLNAFLGSVSLAAPGTGQCLDTGNTKSLLDLFQVAQAQHLEREAAPSVVQWTVDGGCPEVLILIAVFLYEPEIE